MPAKNKNSWYIYIIPTLSRRDLPFKFFIILFTLCYLYFFTTPFLRDFCAVQELLDSPLD